MTASGKRALLLWDVDHTLIENGGVSKATYALAFERLTGSAPVVRPSTDGRTDHEILRNLFAANATNLTTAQEQRFGDVLLDCGKALMPELLEHGYALPGVIAALNRLSDHPTVVQSVLTGNIRENAENKLRLLGKSASLLDLDVGGYGSDDIVRSHLVRVAQSKAGRKYGTAFGRSSTVLVGDTERDVAAAHDGGARIIAVATGASSAEQLRQAGADVVLADVTELSAFLSALARLTGEALPTRA